MTMRTTDSHPDAGALLAYWLGDADTDRAGAVEEHWFACADCAARLQDLVRLCGDLKRLARQGNIRAVLPAAFVEHLRGAGARLREYRLDPGTSVSCTIAPDDDFVLAHLHAPLRDVRRLDLVMRDSSGARLRVEDIAFDPAADGVVLASSSIDLRRLGVSTHHAQLVSVAGGVEDVIGEYTFNHSPYGS